ncbi:Holliday junction resolvase RuvX [soil metagenome]
MSDSGNVIALDVGDRRIGVALANLTARMASPLLTIDCQAEPDVFACILELAREHNAVAVIVGLPRSMEGQETGQTLSARQFAADLRKTVTIAVHLQDEAATSLAAEDDLKASGKPYAKGDIDKLAAAYILRDWLEMTEEAKV